MEEIKQIVYNSSEKLLQKGCNIEIQEQKLLKSESNKIYAQMKMKNLGKKPIKAVFIGIDEYDILHQLISENFEYQYLDLDIWRGEEFGSELTIELSHITSREIKIRIEKVVYLDGKIWSNNNREEPQYFKDFKLMNEILSKELVEQYRRESDDANYITDEDIYCYEEIENNWICTCGGWNFCDEVRCYKCGKQRMWIKRLFDEEILREKFEKYQFQQKNYKQNVKTVSNNIQKNMESQNKGKKFCSSITKRNKIIIGISIICVVVIALISIINSQEKYQMVSDSLTQYENDFGDLLGLTSTSTMWSDYIDDGYYFDDGDTVQSDYEIGDMIGTVRAYEDADYDIGKVCWTADGTISDTNVKTIIKYMKKKYGNVEANDEYTATNSDYDLYSWTNESSDYNIFLFVNENDNDIEITLEEKNYSSSTKDNTDDDDEDDSGTVTGSGNWGGGLSE